MTVTKMIPCIICLGSALIMYGCAALTPSPAGSQPPPNALTSATLTSAIAATPTAAATPPLTPTEMENVRWQKYQNALTSAFLSTATPKIQGLCEWEILGQSGQEVYVWAMCQTAADSDGMAVSAPAVIRLDAKGQIQGVDMPRDGAHYGPDIRQLFPRRVEKMIFDHDVDTGAMWDHIQKRHQHPEPPLIVLTKTPLP